MKVVCIKHFKSQALQFELTYGKVYEVLPKPNWANPESYFIKCDRDFISSYHKNSFILLEEWRENQLKELGI
jgi:hypothetical protein